VVSECPTLRAEGGAGQDRQLRSPSDGVDTPYVLDDQPGPLFAALDPARLFSAGPEALFVLRDGRVECLSGRAIELVGRDLMGTQIRDSIPDWREHGDDSVPFEAVLNGAHGELPVEIRVRALDNGAVVASIRDARPLIARRAAEAALSEAEAKYRSLVEQIPAVVYADDGDVTTYVNPQIQQILGVTPQAYLDDPDMWLRMVHPADRATVEAESIAFLAGQGGDLTDYRMVRPDGRTVWIRDRAFAHRDDEGRVLWEQGILFDVTELKEAEERIAHMAFHDGLTGLANRALFEETLALALERAKRDLAVVAVLFLDLDNFKHVNDTLGHHAGDRLLVEVAARLKGCTRGTDLVARQGGDEFLMLLADLDLGEVDAATRRVAERVHEALEQPFGLQGSEFRPRGSMGISLYPQDAYDAETLLKNADIAMYRAKRAMPGRHAFFSTEDSPSFTT
jgi:diguanylate cyclase (GGDEF)-like protein/PAS domain S-box-containing protein